MTTSYRDLFLDYLDDTLDPEQKQAFEVALINDADLRADFEAYQHVIATEQILARQTHSIHPNFSVKVMDTIERQEAGFFRRYLMSFKKQRRYILVGAATFATLVLAAKITLDTPQSFYDRNAVVPAPVQAPGASVLSKSQELSHADVVVTSPEQKPGVPAMENQAIPPGQRAVTIKVDKTSSVEGWARPGSGVDVHVSSTSGNELTTTTVVNNARIISSSGSTGAGGTSTNTVTTVVPENDAKKIVLAQQSNGEISLSLRADTDSGTLNISAPPGHKLDRSYNRQDEDAAVKGSITMEGKQYSVLKDGSLRPSDIIAKPPQNERISRDASYSDLVTRFKNELDTLKKSSGGPQRSNSSSAKVVGSTMKEEDRKDDIFQKVKERLAELETGENSESLKNNALKLPPEDELRFGTAEEKALPRRVVPEPAGNEKYIEYTENPRTLVARNPVSTFSIDVDTGSYTNARRFLQQGTFPPQESVRVEEFINYFKYNYPVQSKHPFTLTYEVAPAPLESGRYLINLGIKARDLSEGEKPWNLVFLIDVSGSMNSPDKLSLVKRSLRILVDNMRAKDKIALITYAGNAGVKLQPSAIERKQQILQAIDSLGAGGSTNGSAGIRAAYQLAEQHRIPNGVNRVILATDGDFNMGTTSHTELIRLIENKRHSGITLTTIGVGSGNYKESTMEQLANKGNGNYFYLDTFKEARKVFETDLIANMEVVAKDVKLQIEFNPQHILEYRLVGYDNRKLKREDFNNDTIDAGEIGAGHTVTALYEVVFTDSPLARDITSELRYQEGSKDKQLELKKELSSEIAFLKIRYKQPQGSKSRLLEFPLEKNKVHGDVKKTSDDFRFAAAVSYFAHKLRGSQYHSNHSFSEIIELAEGARGEDKTGYRREFIELVRNAKAAAR